MFYTNYNPCVQDLLNRSIQMLSDLGIIDDGLVNIGSCTVSSAQEDLIREQFSRGCSCEQPLCSSGDLFVFLEIQSPVIRLIPKLHCINKIFTYPGISSAEALLLESCSVDLLDYGIDLFGEVNFKNSQEVDLPLCSYYFKSAIQDYMELHFKTSSSTLSIVFFGKKRSFSFSRNSRPTRTYFGSPQDPASDFSGNRRV